MIDVKSEQANEFPQLVQVRSHSFRADVGAAEGSTDSAPSPHDYFDASLATCTAVTATWYAKRGKIPLERVEVHVDRDNSRERQGTYVLKLRVVFHGDALTVEHKRKLHDAVSRCPVHKLMTTATVEIETAPLTL